MFMKLITIKVNKIHIRYEDDVYDARNEEDRKEESNPFSFGVLLDSFNIFNYDRDVRFEQPLDFAYDEFVPTVTDNLYLKKIEVSDIRVYWNSKSAAYIPFSIYEHN